MEAYSLLIGSLGVFFILALVMYFSRKRDWYSIGRLRNVPQEIDLA
jgi:inner membrane protein